MPNHSASTSDHVPVPPPALLCFLALCIPLLLTACAEAPPGHLELTSALTVGRQAWTLFEDIPELCAQTPGSPAEDHLRDQPGARCTPDPSSGPIASLAYDRDHRVAFRYLGPEGSDLTVRSERDGGVLEVAVSGHTVVAGRDYQITVGVLAVAQRGPGYEEAEVALRARFEGEYESLDLDEVRYALREGGRRSFYRTFFDAWQTAAGTFVLEDGVYEGRQTAAGAWQLQAEGMVLLDGAPFAAVEVGGPADARRAVVAVGGEQSEL